MQLFVSHPFAAAFEGHLPCLDVQIAGIDERAVSIKYHRFKHYLLIESVYRNEQLLLTISIGTLSGASVQRGFYL